MDIKSIKTSKHKRNPPKPLSDGSCISPLVILKWADEERKYLNPQ